MIVTLQCLTTRHLQKKPNKKETNYFHVITERAQKGSVEEAISFKLF